MSDHLKECADLYLNIINDVISSVSKKWVSYDGHPNVLKEIGEVWKAKALKPCGVNIPEPNYLSPKKVSEESTFSLDSFLKDVFQTKEPEPLQENTKEEEPEKNEEEDIDLITESESEEEEKKEESIHEEELGELIEISDDSDLNSLISFPESSDILVCHYTNKKMKTAKNAGNSMDLSLSLCHFTINGVPRVTSTGNADVKPNKGN